MEAILNLALMTPSDAKQALKNFVATMVAEAEEELRVHDEEGRQHLVDRLEELKTERDN